MFVQLASRQSIEDVVSFSFGRLLEKLEILEDLCSDLNFIIEPNAVLAQKVKNHSVWRPQGDVFELQRAAAHGIGLVVTFFVASTESEAVNEVHCSRSLSVRHQFILQFLLIMVSNVIDMLF